MATESYSDERDRQGAAITANDGFFQQKNPAAVLKHSVLDEYQIVSTAAAPGSRSA